MHVILYPGSVLTVSEASLIEITALADVQQIGAPNPPPTTVPTVNPTTPVQVTITPAPKS